MKPILCLDFDGVLHSYTSGWKGAAIIPDEPVPGAMEFLAEAVEKFKVNIFSSRSGQIGGINAMINWLHDWLGKQLGVNRAAFVLDQIEFPTEKPPALVTLDDRAITFTGTFPSIDTLLNFKPWNKS